MKTSFQKLPSEITSRELEVIQLISNEFSSREIANLLYISEETVKSHRKNIRKKLKVKNVAGVVRVAFQTQLISLQSGVALAS